MTNRNVPSRPEISGDLPHDAPDGSDYYPIKIGCVAKSIGSNPGTVGSGDRANIICDQFGIQFASISHPWSFQTFTANASGTTGSSLIAAPGDTASGLQINISDIVVSSNTSTVAGVLQLQLYGGTTTNELLRIRLPDGNTVEHTFRFGLKCGAGNALLFTSNTGVAMYIGGHYA